MIIEDDTAGWSLARFAPMMDDAQQDPVVYGAEFAVVSSGLDEGCTPCTLVSVKV